MKKVNLIRALVFVEYVLHRERMPEKSWIDYVLMDAATCRLRNPSLPYTDISKRLFNFVLRKR